MPEEKTMKLHMFPSSTTCRPILLLCAEHEIKIEPIVVDLMALRMGLLLSLIHI